MKKHYSLIIVLAAFLLAGCKNFTPQTCKVTVVTPLHGTIKVDKTECLMGDVITITAKPESGYKVSLMSINGTSYSGTNSGSIVTLDDADARVFYYIANEADILIQTTFLQANRYKLSLGTASHGTYTVNPDPSSGSVYEQSEVEVTVTPDAKYHTGNKSVFVYGSNGKKVPGIQDEKNPNKFIFVMPGCAAIVNVTCCSNVYFVPVKTDVEQGEKITFKVVNPTSDTSGYDLYVNDKKIQSNVSITDDALLEIFTDSLEPGSVSIYAKKGDYTTDKIQGTIRYKESSVPTGYKAYKLWMEDYSITAPTSSSEGKVSFKLYTDLSSSSTAHYEYYYESDPTNITTKSGYLSSSDYKNYYLPLTDVNYTYDAPDVLVVRIYDDTYGKISGKVRIDVPCYTALTSTPSATTMNGMNLATADVKNENIVISEDAKKYIDVSYDSSNYYKVLGKLPTNIQRKVLFKDSSGKICAGAFVTVNYKGVCSIKYVKKGAKISGDSYSQRGITISGSSSTFYFLNSSSYSSSDSIDNVDIVIKDAQTQTELERQKSSIVSGKCTYTKSSKTPAAATGKYEITLDFGDGLVLTATELTIK